MSTTPAVTFNNVDLATLGMTLKSRNCLRITPTRRGDNIKLPLLDGELFRPGKKYDSPTMVVNLLIKGINPATGKRTYGLAEEHYERNISKLLQLLHTDTVLISHTRTTGEVRQCLCEVVDVMDFTQVAKAPLWNQVSINFKVISAFWEDVSPVALFNFTLASGETRVLTELAGAEAPMTDMVITFTNFGYSCVNPSIRQNSTGVYVKYAGTIPGGRVLNIHTLTGELTDAGGPGWSAPGIQYANLQHAGDSRLFSLRPEIPSVSNPTGSPIITIEHTGGGTIYTALSIRKKYMTG